MLYVVCVCWVLYVYIGVEVVDLCVCRLCVVVSSDVVQYVYW